MVQFYAGSEFFNYLIKISKNDDPERIPSLQDLSKELKIGVSTLREQLEVAKALGLVDVKPRTGIRRLPYSFFPAVEQSLSFAIQISPEYFRSFTELRNHLEEAYWYEAVRLLTPEDHSELFSYLTRAMEKLNGNPIQIPHYEHRQLHMRIYRQLKNPFVLGILEAFWDAYEAVGLSVYADYSYLQEVWGYHRQMVEAIIDGDFDSGYQALVSHKDLLFHHPVNEFSENLEVIDPI